MGTLHGILRCVVSRSVRAERADRAGSEDSACFLSGHFQSVVETSHTYFPCELRFGFSHGAEQGCEVIDGVHLIFIHSLGDLPGVGYVHNVARAAFEQLSLRLGSGDIAGYYVASRILVAQLHGELSAYLACCAYDEYVLHVDCVGIIDYW